MKEIVKLMESSIDRLNVLIEDTKSQNRTDIIIYRGIKVPLSACIEQGNYYHIPRRIINKFSNEGSDLIEKNDCTSFEDYVKDLEHHRDTTIGLWATDRPDLIGDPKKVLFEIK